MSQSQYKNTQGDVCNNKWKISPLPPFLKLTQILKKSSMANLSEAAENDLFLGKVAIRNLVIGLTCETEVNL